jgi:hypothetical protein
MATYKSIYLPEHEAYLHPEITLANVDHAKTIAKSVNDVRSMLNRNPALLHSLSKIRVR